MSDAAQGIPAVESADSMLANGMRFVCERLPRSQGVALAMRIPVGLKDDPEDKPGLAHLVADTILKATKKKNPRALSDAFDFYGIRVSANAGMESITISMRCLPEHISPAFGLLREVLCTPSFPEQQCKTAIVHAEQELKHMEDDPPGMAFARLKELYFGTRWGHSELGTFESLKTLKRSDFTDFWKRHFVSGGVIAAAAGKVDHDLLAKELETLMPIGRQPHPAEDAPPPPHSTISKHIKKDSQQTQISMAFHAVPRRDPRSYQASVAVGVLSGGMSGRLFTEVREKRSLVYSVGASMSSLRSTGCVMAYAGTTAPRAAETLSVLRGELARLGDDASTEEVERAKNAIRAHILMDQESTGARVRELLDDVYFEGRVVSLKECVDRLLAVTAEEVRAYWKAHPAEPYALVTVGREPLQ